MLHVVHSAVDMYWIGKLGTESLASIAVSRVTVWMFGALGILIGALTFSGSVVAFLKLSARISGKPMLLPFRHWLNLILLVLALGKPAETVVLDELGEDGDIAYWRDENDVHHVPKRSLDDLII